MRMSLFAAAALGLALAGAARAGTIFEADFQNGKADGWVVDGNARLSTYRGNVSLLLTDGAAATATLSTAGFTGVSATVAFAASGLDNNESCIGEVSPDGGESWVALYKIRRGQDDGVTLHSGGGTVPGLDDNANLRLRVRAATHGGTCWADNIVVTGAPGMAQALPTTLTYEQMMGTQSPVLPASFSAFAPPTQPAPTKNRFEGRLVFAPVTAQVKSLRDDGGDFKDSDSPAHRMPAFDFAFVQSGNALIPVRRGAIPGVSPQWEYILEPGRVWDASDDNGYTRASLPFTLEERNANCMHNGVLTFLFKSDGAVSNVVFQIGSETCLYSKFDMWGETPARYLPGAIPNAAQIAAAYASEIAHRLPTKPIAALAADYPGIDPAQFGSPAEIDPADMTAYGVVVKGVNYVGGCDTRFGAYPYCAEMDLPSYSLAKTIFAAEAAMRLSLLYPGAMQRKIADYVPECAKTGTWGDVTFQNALDMATGHYLSAADQADEDAPDIAPFFIADTHAGRIAFACDRYPRQTAPGTRWVYHTADIYTLGAALRAFYRGKAGADAPFVKDVLTDPIWHKLHLNPAIDAVRRSYDSVAEPFAGWGLTLHSDDIAKLADFLSVDAGMLDGKQILDPKMLAAALQRDPSDPGLRASNDDIRYHDGVWAWIPFMSGYGGIAVAMMPDGIAYYYVSDGGKFAWARAAAEADKINPFCKR